MYTKQFLIGRTEDEFIDLCIHLSDLSTRLRSNVPYTEEFLHRLCPVLKSTEDLTGTAISAAINMTIEYVSNVVSIDTSRVLYFQGVKLMEASPVGTNEFVDYFRDLLSAANIRIEGE
jgi:hypothetical protein